MRYLKQKMRVRKNSCTLTIPTKLLFRCAVASHNNKSHCFSAQNSSQDYFGCRRVKIFSSLFFTLSTPLKSIFGGLGVQPKSNLKVIRFMV